MSWGPLAVCGLALVAVFALIAGETLAENECGPAGSGSEIVCAPSNYDSADEGNVFYAPEASDGNFRIRLIDGLVIDYDSDDPDDDAGFSPADPATTLHGAVSIIPGDPGYTGDITVSSSAEVNSKGSGILVVHAGESGALRAELNGGGITTRGDHGTGVDILHEGAGDIGIVARNIAINTNGSIADGIDATHKGEGDIGIDVRDVTIATLGRNADGVYGSHEGAEGDIRTDVQDTVLMTNGDEAEGILMIHAGAGELEILVRDALIQTEGDGAEGIHGLHRDEGDVNIEVSNSEVSTIGAGASGIRGSHGGTGDIDIDLRDVVITTEGRNADGVFGLHVGDAGDIRIGVRGGSVTTMGDEAEAVRGTREGAGKIRIDLQGVELKTMGQGAEAVIAVHSGAGDIELNVQEATIATEGQDAGGVHGLHQRDSEGGVFIDVQNTQLTTTGPGAYGVRGSHGGTGHIDIDLSDVTITTESRNADGIYGFHVGDTGDVRLDVRGGGVSTLGDEAEAVLAIHEGMGEIEILVRNALIQTEGQGAEGIHGLHREDGDIRLTAQDSEITTMGQQATGLRGTHGGTGHIDIDLSAVTISTEGVNADGVYGYHVGDAGDIRVDVRGGGVTTKGEEAEAVLATLEGMGEIEILVRDTLIQTEGQGAEGVHGLHRDIGDVRIDVRGTEIMTTGVAASGVRGSHGDAGEIDIHVRDTEIAASNSRAHGIAAYHGGSGSVRITVDGGSVSAAGTDASGVRVGNIDSRGRVTLAAEAGEDGYRKQSVMVNGSVTGGSGRDAAGVFLAGGGKAVIGPKGSVGAESGVAIRAAGDESRLHVDMNLDGRRVAQVIGDNHIVNDGDETTLLINGVVLYDGASGATGLEAPNGAWDVTLLEGPTITGRAFSYEDFNAAYAPRAAVYEALPGLLLRLNGRGATGKRIVSPDSPVWVRLSNGRGSYEAGRASVGAKYDFHRFGAEAGLRFSIGQSLSGSVSARYVHGSADVESPVGDGEIIAQGLGLGLGASWRNDAGYYADARTSLTSYDVDASTEKRGRLTDSGGALAYSLGFEAGRRIEPDEKILGRKMKLTPRAWMRGAGFFNADFTDAVNSRVSLNDTAQLSAGLGLAAITERSWDEGGLSLRVSLDIEQTLGGAETTAEVSGEKLESESAETRALLGLGGTYRQGPFSFGAELTAGGLGSDDEEYSGRLDFGMKF